LVRVSGGWSLFEMEPILVVKDNKHDQSLGRDWGKKKRAGARSEYLSNHSKAWRKKRGVGAPRKKRWRSLSITGGREKEGEKKRIDVKFGPS